MKTLILALAVVGLNAYAQEIKGLSLGMSKTEVMALFPDSKPMSASISKDDKHLVPLTVANIESKYRNSGALITFSEDKLVSFQFYFKSEEFDSMRRAIREKYPELQCSDSTVTNRMGAEFTDTKCQYKNLRLDRFIGDINTSMVGMVDPSFLTKKYDSQTKKAVGDL